MSADETQRHPAARHAAMNNSLHPFRTRHRTSKAEDARAYISDGPDLLPRFCRIFFQKIWATFFQLKCNTISITRYNFSISNVKHLDIRESF